MRKKTCIAAARMVVTGLALCGLGLSQSSWAQSSFAQSSFAQTGPVRPKLPIYSGPKNEVYSGQILIKFKANRAKPEIDAASAQSRRNQLSVGELTRIEDSLSGGHLAKALPRGGWTLWQIPRVLNPKAAAEKIMTDPAVLSASPVNKIYPLLTVPNDGDWNYVESGPPMVLDLLDEGNANFRRLWHLDDTDAFNAWSNFPNKWYTAFNKPRNAPLIAIIDTGCDMDHPDFINAGGLSSDAAQGGQIEKSLSRQFFDGEVLADGDTNDTNGHGTHVSGLAVAAGNNGSFNGKGSIGIGYNSRAMILRVFDDQGAGSDMDAAMAIFYAADNGADVINLSLGTTNYSQIFQDAVTYAWQKGSLVVAAGNEAGNGGGNLGPIYPAACSGALAVTANGPGWIPANDNYAGYGSYVDVAAPGGNLVTYSQFEFALQYDYSTACRLPCALSESPALEPPYTLEYSYLIGTSMACPVVSGAAGLYYGKYNLHQSDGFSNVRAYRAIEKSVQGTNFVRNGGWELTQGFGSIDVEALLREQDSRLATVGSIEGIVYYGGTALANVRVTAKPIGKTKTYQTTTLRDGTYRFDGVPPGIYAVKAVPFGSAKTKTATVMAGSDQTGTDFYCGPAVIDDTPPTIAKFGIVTASQSTLAFDLWGYDTETGIDCIEVKVGSTPGASDLVAPREVVPTSTRIQLSNLNLPVNYSVTITVTNGEGLKSVARRDVIVASNDAYVRDGTFATQNFGTLSDLLVKKSNAGFNRATIVQFPIESVGSASVATLRFVARPAWSNLPISVLVQSTTNSAWNQATVNWNNRPGFGALTSTPVAIPSGGDKVFEVDVTNMVRAAKQAGSPTITLALLGVVNTDEAALVGSLESGKPAQLIVQSVK